MIKRIALFFLIILFVCVAQAAEKWLAPEAQYKLTVWPETPTGPTSVDLRRQVLPVLPDKGVAVFDDAGAPVPYQLHDNLSLSIAPSPKSKHFAIYFGFANPQPRDSWKPDSGARPPAQRLKLDFFPGSNQICTPEEFLQRRNSDIARQSRWTILNFPKRAMTLLMQRDFGIEPPPWVPRFPQYYKNRQNLWKRVNARNRNQRLNAALELTGRPYIQRQESFNRSWIQHMKNHFLYIRRESDRIDGLYSQAKKDMVHGAETDLLNIINRRWKRELNATEVQLIVRPPETPEHYSARFSGFLQIPSDGEYEFELQTNSLTILKLNGQIAARRINADGSEPAKLQTFRQSFKKGSVPFELFYRLNSGYGQLLLRMRPSGNGDFLLLAAENFTPAPPGKPSELTDRDGKKYPLVSRRGHYLLYTDKLNTQLIEQFDFATPPEEVEWTLHDRKAAVSELPPVVILPTESDTRLSFSLKEPADSPQLPVIAADYQDDLVPLRPDLELKLWAPALIYDDEALELTLDGISRLPFPVAAQLRFTADRPSEQLQTETSVWELPAKPDERFNRSSMDAYRKRSFRIVPEALRPFLTLSFDLSITDFLFDRKQLKVIPVSAAENLTMTAEGLTDATGDSVTLVLHRPRLSELRNWELPRKIDDELAGKHKVLVISEVLDDLNFELAENLCEQKRTLEFFSYEETETPLQSSLPKLFQVISASNADQAVLVLPRVSRLGMLECWERDRYVAALLEKLRQNRNFRTILLATPPWQPDEMEAGQELQMSLRRLAREYGVQLLEQPIPESGQSSANPDNFASELTKKL